MARTEDQTALDRGALSNIWRNTLLQIPSVFGRLVYVSSLRNPNNGRYDHHGLAQIYGEDDSNKALKKSHLQIFEEWLTFNLEQQARDLEVYLAGLSDPRETVLQTWIKLAPYRNLIPAAVRGVERKLYVKDLTTLLELLKTSGDGAGPDRDASRRR